MADGCGGSIMKFLLFGTNIIIFLLSAVVLGFSIYAYVDGGDFSNLIDQADDGDFDLSLFSAGILILIVMSAAIMIISFLGCCGAMKESRCMLFTYFLLTLALFILFIIGAVVGYAQSLDKAEAPLLKSMKSYVKEDDTNDITKAWDAIQTDIECCGVNNHSEWKTQGIYPDSNNYLVPASCCINSKVQESDVDKCQKDPDQYLGTGQDGCLAKIRDTFDDNQTIVLGVTIGVIVFIFLNMIFAFGLCQQAGK